MSISSPTEANNIKMFINSHVTNELSKPLHLDESIFILRGIGSNFFIFISFFDENPVSKQKSPGWDTGFCGVTPGGYSVCLCPIKRTTGLYGLTIDAVYSMLKIIALHHTPSHKKSSVSMQRISY